MQIKVSVDGHTTESKHCSRNAGKSWVWTKKKKASKKDGTCFELSKDYMRGCRSCPMFALGEEDSTINDECLEK